MQEAYFGGSAQGSAEWKYRVWERGLGAGLGQMDWSRDMEEAQGCQGKK